MESEIKIQDINDLNDYESTSTDEEILKVKILSGDCNFENKLYKTMVSRVKNIEKLKDVHLNDIQTVEILGQSLYEKLISLQKRSRWKAIIFKNINYFLAFLIIGLGFVISLLSLFDVNSNQSPIMFIIAVLGILVSLVTGIKEKSDLRQKSVIQKSINLQMSKITRKLIILKCTETDKEVYLNKIMRYYHQLDKLHLSLFSNDIHNIEKINELSKVLNSTN